MIFELTILGSSSAIPTSGKYPTAQVLNVHERFFLIDCGEGTQIQIRHLKVNFAKIRHIFISHLHGDHYFGLPGFISTRNLLGITSDIHIYSHPDLRNLLQPMLDQMKGEMGFTIFFHSLDFTTPECIFSDKKVEVISFPLRHTIPCCGFLFREKSPLPNIRKEKIGEYRIPVRDLQAIKEGADFQTDEGITIPNRELVMPLPPPRSYAFCTDTAYHEPCVEVIFRADLLYHEATFLEELKEWAARTCHSTASQAATLALKARVSRLLLGHISSRYKNPELTLREAQKIFPATELAVDGTHYSIGPVRQEDILSVKGEEPAEGFA